MFHDKFQDGAIAPAACGVTRAFRIVFAGLRVGFANAQSDRIAMLSASQPIQTGSSPTDRPVSAST